MRNPNTPSPTLVIAFAALCGVPSALDARPESGSSDVRPGLTLQTALPESAPPVSARNLARQAEIRGLHVRDRQRLRSALELAVRAVQERPACSALFDRLDASGPGLLGGALYQGASGDEERNICGRGGVTAFTQIGGTRVGLCAAAAPRLDRHTLAALLVHEALHLAGLPEAPAAPDAMTSAEITEQVRRRCDL